MSYFTHGRQCGLPGRVPAWRVFPALHRTPCSSVTTVTKSLGSPLGSMILSRALGGQHRSCLQQPGRLQPHRNVACGGYCLLLAEPQCTGQVQPRRSGGRQVHRPCKREPEREKQGGGVLTASLSSQESLEGIPAAGGGGGRR